MQYSRKNILLVGGAIVALFLGLYYTRWMQSSPPMSNMTMTVIGADVQRNSYEAIMQTAIEATTIMIHIVGEVMNPGTYEFELGARVQNAIDAAGGVTEYANIRYLNLAAHLRDADHIIVPTIGVDTGGIMTEHVALITNSSPEVSNQSGLVNINTASRGELQTLPGIGPTLAERIIEHRDQNGRFTAIEEIMSIQRIGNATFEAIRDLITV